MVSSMAFVILILYVKDSNTHHAVPESRWHAADNTA
jgi:hypothetical protein